MKAMDCIIINNIVKMNNERLRALTARNSDVANDKLRDTKVKIIS